ncbi:MAG: hypothetical protein ACK5FT_07555 [Sphingomonadales bacterium]|jgi:hypothetical protein
MRWRKKGLIYSPSGEKHWLVKYAMMPTPIVIESKNIIRVFIGVTDSQIYGRTTFIDLDIEDPSVIIKFPQNIILDIGEDGFFDDSGAIPSSVLTRESISNLYYVGFQRTTKVPYMLFSGMAVSTDLENFRKHSKAPIMDRNPLNQISNAAPFVIFDEGIFKMWMWVGKQWISINNKKYIEAEIKYATSIDSINWDIQSASCIQLDYSKEFSLGRPWVLKDKDIYKMWYSVRYIDKLYRIGYAESHDGINWIRKDEEVGIDVSSEGWDSEMICYPSVISVKGRTYMFYNGNNNGESGFGYAELIEE